MVGLFSSVLFGEGGPVYAREAEVDSATNSSFLQGLVRNRKMLPLVDCGNCCVRS